MRIIEKFLLSIFKVGPTPKHIAFIMDGNRRYAAEKKIEKKSGHTQGVASLENILEYSFYFGVKEVSIFAFSIENFNREKEEVDTLMELAEKNLMKMAEKNGFLH